MSVQRQLELPVNDYYFLPVGGLKYCTHVGIDTLRAALDAPPDV
ncbi:MAG: hypothetical protein O3B01_16005 [Planctomycetota bacterium]|nr:hypothetical protein [Planctomycetota bacterium]MDA1140078.1 hypothetical protein [Planctomycetota bacterium]